MNEIKTGTYEGTGAAVTLELGFVPDYIEVINTEDGDEVFKWWNGLTAAHAIKIANHDTAQVSRITSNGVTANAGDEDTSAGVTLGTALSEDGKTYHYVAVRSGAGAQ